MKQQTNSISKIKRKQNDNGVRKIETMKRKEKLDRSQCHQISWIYLSGKYNY